MATLVTAAVCIAFFVALFAVELALMALDLKNREGGFLLMAGLLMSFACVLGSPLGTLSSCLVNGVKLMKLEGRDQLAVKWLKIELTNTLFWNAAWLALLISIFF